jgi:hypothetical protein
MADIDRIKRNITKMIEQGAPESDIDAYVAEEGVTPEQLQAHKVAPPIGVGEDVARAGAKGLGRGLASIPGAFGDVAGINRDIFSWAAGKLGAPEWAKEAAGWAGKASAGPLGFFGPTTDQISGVMADATRPEDGQSFMDYKPQTLAGDYTQTLGEFAPSVAMGPGRMGAKLATGAASAIGSETAGQLAEGTAYEPYARFAGAVLGGAAPNIRSPKNAALKAAPEADEVKAQTRAAYAAVKQADIVYDKNAFSQFVDRVGNSMADDGIDQVLHPKAFRALERIAKLDGASPDYQEIETLRRIAGDVLKTNDPSEYRMAAKLLSELDGLEASGAYASRKGYSQDQVRELTTNARELGRRNAILGDMAEMDRRSEWYLGGDESGMRNQIGSYGRSAKGKRMTDAEKQAFKSVVRREGLQNLGGAMGNRISMATLPTLGAGAGMSVGGPIGAAVGFGLGAAGSLTARKAMELSTRRSWNRAKKTVALGKKGQKGLRRASLPPAILPRLGLFGMGPAQANE